jgi:hypothetical protein
LIDGNFSADLAHHTFSMLVSTICILKSSFSSNLSFSDHVLSDLSKLFTKLKALF